MSGLLSGFAVPIEAVYEGPPVTVGDLRRLVPTFFVPQSYIVVARNRSLAQALAEWSRDCRQVRAAEGRAID